MSQEDHDVEIALLRLQVSQINNNFDKLEKQMESLLSEWQRANGALSFIKWALGLGAFFSMIVSLLHLGGTK